MGAVRLLVGNPRWPAACCSSSNVTSIALKRPAGGCGHDPLRRPVLECFTVFSPVQWGGKKSVRELKAALDQWF